MVQLAELLEVAERRGPEYIRWMQGALNQVAGARLPLDGVMGPRTRAALRSFQSVKGLVADGVAGPKTEAMLIRAGARKPGAPSGSAPSARPALLKREDKPPAATFYFQIPLGDEHPARPMTGVFIPEKYQLVPDSAGGARVDLLLWLHGIKKSTTLTIDDYWNSRRYHELALREGVNDSHKNVVLVAPTLGPRSQWQAGRLIKPGGFDWYLNQVMANLAGIGPWARTRLRPHVGDVIIACHSGGGYPMRILATGKDRFAASIRECWGFDCLYNTGDAEIWAGWARRHPQSRLFIYYQDSTRNQSELLKRKSLPNVSVERSPARGHDWVPITHWVQRLQQAGFLRNR